MHSIAQELARHAAALRGLAFDLVGEAADDVVQDAAVEALRAPPRRPGPVGGWLAGIVRHLASRHRRGERRRKAREQRAARAELVPPDDTFSDRELFERLTAAVMALPEPYQGTVLRRYLRECSPLEIARETGVPVATVKTRLQRGLAMLRQRLAREGADWRPALQGAFGLDGVLPRVASAFKPTGVLLMGTGAKLGLGCIALALLAALWWSFGSEPAASSPSASSGPHPTIGGSLTGAAPSPTGNERQEVPAGAAAAPLEEGRTMVRGRCVDEQGAPLPHCEVELRGRKVLERGGPDLRREYGEWLVAHPDRAFHDATAETDQAGRFEFTFDFVPLAYQLRLRRDVPNHLVRVGALQPDSVKDLGDIVLPASCELHGRIVDTNGAAVVAPVHIGPHSGSYNYPTQAVERVSGPAAAGPGGTFVSHLMAGEHDLWVEDRDMVSSKTLTIPSGCAHMELEIVVRASTLEDTISGQIVDEQGQAVAGVSVMVPIDSGSRRTLSDAGGQFTLFRPSKRNPDQVMLCVTGLHDNPLIRWGTQDLRLVVKREPEVQRDVELQVVRGRDGSPVTDYEIHSVGFVDFDGHHGPEATVTRSQGDRHDGGIVRLPGITTRPLRLLVIPDRSDLWMAIVPVPEGTASQRIEVRLTTAVHRLLRVRHHDGSPADSVMVEQLVPSSQSLSLAIEAYPVEDWEPGGSVALLLQRTTSDEHGEVQLRGPADGTIGLRLPGPPGVLVPEVRFDTDEPLVVTLPCGGRLEAQLGPPELVRELRHALGWPAAGPVQTVDPKSQIGFLLQRGTGNVAECIPPADQGMAMVAGDGSFAIDNVPAGHWTLMLGGAEDRNRAGDRAAEAVCEVELRAGETTLLAIDLPERVTGELQGQLLLNGAPMVNEGVMVYASRGKAGERPQACWGYDLRTDAEGRFHLRMLTGTARVVICQQLYLPGFGVYNLWPSRDGAFVPAGGSVSQAFHFDRGKVRLRALGSDGNPRSGVSVLVRGDDGRIEQTTTSATDGWILADVDAHPFTAQVLPRSVTRAFGSIFEWEYELALGMRHEDPFPGQWLTLGRVAPKAGETVEVELRLPPEWDR